MSWFERIAWNIYLLVLALFIWERAFLFFNPDSAIRTYYEMLFYFDPRYFIPYFLNFLQVLSGFFFLFIVAVFVYRQKAGNRIFWQAFFFLRLVLDITGQNYEANHIASYFQIGTRFGWMALLFYNAIYLPGYLALWIYAFYKPDKL